MSPGGTDGHRKIQYCLPALKDGLKKKKSEAIWNVVSKTDVCVHKPAFSNHL